MPPDESKKWLLRASLDGPLNRGVFHPGRGALESGGSTRLNPRNLRTMMVQSAHYILGPFGADSDLRRWGSEGGGAWRQECKETSRGGRGAKVVHPASSTVVKW
jgi:hypothetical protein